MSADQVGIAAEFDRSVQAISRAFGSALVLALAISTVVWSMLSVKFGKRPVCMLHAFPVHIRYSEQYADTLPDIPSEHSLHVRRVYDNFLWYNSQCYSTPYILAE